jgi:hypothetical protein
MAQINQYPLTATQINNEDYYDVDYWTGSGYESRKISGASLIALLGGSVNVYNSDGSLTSNRTIDGGTSFKFSISKILSMLTDVTPLVGQIAWDLNVLTTNLLEGTKIFRVYDTGSFQERFSIDNGGNILINESYYLPNGDGTTKQFLTTNGTGLTYWENIDQNILGNNFASTQWETTAASVPLVDGNTANGFTFFVPTDKVASGTTSWDEYNLEFGIQLTISGTSGTIQIEFGPITGTEFSEQLTFSGTLNATVEQWVINNKNLALANGNARILYNGGSTIRFCASEAVCNSVATTFPTNDMGSSRVNIFTGIDAAAIDHVLIPYVGKPYQGQRLQHRFRVNFGIETGSAQTLALSLRRFSDDSIIGSEIKVTRDQDVEGNQFNFISYTSNANDPFVTGGFYFALRNNSGTTISINGAVGVYIETSYQIPTTFP